MRLTKNEVKKELMLLKLRAGIKKKSGRSSAISHWVTPALLASQRRQTQSFIESIGIDRFQSLKNEKMSGRLAAIWQKEKRPAGA